MAGRASHLVDNLAVFDENNHDYVIFKIQPVNDSINADTNAMMTDEITSQRLSSSDWISREPNFDGPTNSRAHSFW